MRHLSSSLLFILLLLTGCGKLTVENYDKIKIGLPYADVVNILGTPAACDDVLGIKTCKWGDGARKVMVSFMGDKVILTSAENIQ
jgi:hypothetical protein